MFSWRSPLSQFSKYEPFMLNSKWAFRGLFYKVRGRLNKSGFEEGFTDLLQSFPKAEKYLVQLHHHRERWAVAFSLLSF